MWELLFEAFSWIFGRSKEKSPSVQVETNIPSTPERSQNEKRSLKALQYYNSAEQNRKAGHVKKAEENYWESIKRWNKYKGKPAPAPFRELAKLYYHTGFTENAVEVINSYLNPSHWPEDLLQEDGTVEAEEMELLKERFEKENFRQLKNKYEEKPTGDYP